MTLKPFKDANFHVVDRYEVGFGRILSVSKYGITHISIDDLQDFDAEECMAEKPANKTYFEWLETVERFASEYSKCRDKCYQAA